MSEITSGQSTTSSFQDFIHPDIEAFFIAVALQHDIGPHALTPNQIWATRINLRNIFMAHPGKPAVFQDVLRAQLETGGAFLRNGRVLVQRYRDSEGTLHVDNPGVDNRWFWDNMADSMIRYMARHYQKTGHMPDEELKDDLGQSPWPRT